MGVLRSCVLLPLVATSCGGGVASIAYLLGRSGDDASRVVSVTLISDVVLADDGRVSPATVAFRLTDAGSRPIAVELLLVPPVGSMVPLQLVGNPDLSALASSPTGTTHTFQWDFEAQLPSGAAVATGLRLLARLAGATAGAESLPFDVGNDAPVVSGLVAPAPEISGPIAVAFHLADSSGDVVDITVEYSDLATPTSWQVATPLGGDLQNLGTTESGGDFLFLWDVEADEPQREFGARLRFTPTDDWDTGVAVESADLLVDNNAPPTVIVDGSGFFADDDDRRGLPLHYEVLDDEGDPLQVVVQWMRPLEPFPSLPSDPAALAAILDDEDLRHQYQIATEQTIAHVGVLQPVAADGARMHELAAGAAGLAAEWIVGRRLEVLAVPGAPLARSASWSSNPLTTPVAAVPIDGGPSAFVLEQPSLGQWRVREIDLATGAVLRDLAAGSDGDPAAMAAIPGSRDLMIATGLGGVWTLSRLAAQDGARTILFTADATVPAGTVRGLATVDRDSAVVTVAGALVAVDVPASLAAVARSLVSGLQTPTGVAVDPRRASRIFVAESDWVNPTTSLVEGRVLVVDRVSLVRRTLVSSGVALRRPTAIAIERHGARLLAVTDSNTADAVRELRAVDLGNGGGGPAFQISASLPVAASALACGADDLRLLCVPSASDLFVGGGVQQARDVVAYDAATHAATADASFAPPLVAGQRWRIRDQASPLPSGLPVRADAFVWDTTDTITGGDVVLEATPYDTEIGVATDTSVPRTVRVSLDVEPTHLGGVATNSDATGVAAADLDGDGDFDLVCANRGANTASIFFQDASHQFPAAPSLTLQGIPILAPMTQPVAVVAVDADTDGDLDLVFANHGSNNLTVARQTSPGGFTVQPLSLGTGITGPTGVVAADFNGNGTVDIACSNDGSNNVAIFNQLGGGLYSPIPSAVIGDATTLAPSGLDVGDLDGDGDLDLVVACRGSNRIALFRQAAGAFPTAPSQLLGGAGMTDGPESVRLADFDGDGRLDLVCTNGTGNCVSVFLQRSSGSFVAAPDATLASSGGPVGPLSVAASDVNGDGALDVVATSAGNAIVVFMQDRTPGTFLPRPLVIRGANDVLAPAGIALEDLDDDGRLDLVSANQGGDDLTVFVQRSGRSFSRITPQIVLGSAVDTPDVRGVAIADVDADGDLDVAAVSAGDGTIALFQQLAPGSLLTAPGSRLGGVPSTAGASAIDAADFTGDGRVDLVTVNRGARTLTAWVQRSDGTFATAPDLVLGGSAFVDPASVVIADLDDDGDFDFAVADRGSDHVELFHQSAVGTFPSMPDATLGSAATTNGPVFLLATDIDSDGRCDLVTANVDANTLSIFRQQVGGMFPSAPSTTLGGAAQTSGAIAVAASDVDGDGDIDVVSANQAGNSVTIFLAIAPGSFPGAPSLTLTTPSLAAPTTVALADVDGDGSCDVAVGSSSSDRLVLFFQGNPATFATSLVLGSTSFTSSPMTLRVVDLDGDGDADLVSAQPDLDDVAVYFGGR